MFNAVVSSEECLLSKKIAYLIYNINPLSSNVAFLFAILNSLIG